jgi:hypothetical protein
MCPLHCSPASRRAPYAELALLPTMIGLFLLTACVSAGAPDGFGAGRAATREQPCVLDVESQNWTNLQLFAVRENGTRVSLGRIRSLEARRIPVPTDLMVGQPIRLLVVTAGLGESYVTEAVLPEPGKTLRLTLDNNLAMSRVVVR